MKGRRKKGKSLKRKKETKSESNEMEIPALIKSKELKDKNKAYVCACVRMCVYAPAKNFGLSKRRA